MILGFTGHRRLDHPELALAKEIRRWLLALKPDKTISGMALGFDQLAARVSVSLGIPFIAAVPAKEQPNRWPIEAQRCYHKILDRAERIVLVDHTKGGSPDDNFIDKLFKRNHWIVDHSDKILAYYQDPLYGGTGEAVRYALSKSKLVLQLTLGD